MPDAQELRDAGRLAECPECGSRIPVLHCAAFAVHRGPRRWRWKVASWCLVCETYFIVTVSQPKPGRTGGRPRARYGGPAEGPEAEIAYRAVFGRGVGEPIPDGRPQ